MPFFTPITSATQLPAIGANIERAVMDWKHPGQVGATHFHKAKDLAAFANHLGGTLVVGACEDDTGQLAKYEGLTRAQLSAIGEAFSQAVEKRCPIPPTIDFADFVNPQTPSNPDSRVLAVNVWPSLRLVGVKIEAHKPSEGYGGDSYVYPVRCGTDARYLNPAEIPMYMTPEIRRIAVLLSKIPTRTRVTVRDVGASNSNERIFVGVDEENNAVRFQGEREYCLPLDQFTTAYQHGNDGMWLLVLGRYR